MTKDARNELVQNIPAATREAQIERNEWNHSCIDNKWILDGVPV